MLAFDQLVGDHVDLGVDQGLAAGDRDHRGAALLDRADRLLDRHPPAQLVLGVLDLAAARAGEVALEQRLELHDQRELLAFGQPLAHQVQPMRVLCLNRTAIGAYLIHAWSPCR